MIVVRRGDKGTFVALLQERLNFHGHYLGQDGIFGRLTERVLKDFQFAWNLTVDGVCGDQTWGCLMQSKGLNKGGVFVKRRTPEILGERLEAVEGASEDGIGLCKVAIGDLGKEESPWGRNKGKDISHLVQGTRITGVESIEFSEYKRHWGIGNMKFFPPWCAIAVSSWMAEYFEASSWSEIPFENWFGGVTQTMKWGDQVEGGLRRKSEIGHCLPGELFVMPRSGSGSDGDDGDGAKIRGGHIGMVMWDDGDRIQTVEGNTQNGVRTRSRLKETLWGIVDWERVVENNGWSA